MFFETKAVHHISNTFHQLSVFFQYQFKKEKWKVSTPETTIDCSATAYFFAKQITGNS